MLGKNVSQLLKSGIPHNIQGNEGRTSIERMICEWLEEGEAAIISADGTIIDRETWYNSKLAGCNINRDGDIWFSDDGPYLTDPDNLKDEE
jgi:hypothetical protein